MVKINIAGSDYTVAFIDNKDTVKTMVGAKLDVLPKYIKIKTFKPENKKITIEFLSDKLKKLSVDKLSAEISELSKEWSLSQRDIALFWIHIKKGGVDASNQKMLQELDKIDHTNFRDYDSVAAEYQRYKKNLQENLRKVKEDAVKENKYRQKYKDYSPVPTTNFLKDSLIVQYTLTIDLDPLEAFDSLVLSKDIPFARLKVPEQDYYKVLKNVKPLEVWTKNLSEQKDLEKWKNSNNVLILKITSKDGWENAVFEYLQFGQVFTVSATLEIASGLDEQRVYRNIMKLFTGAKIEKISRVEQGIKGLFGIPDVKLNRDIFLDLLTNEPMVSEYLYTDEKTKSGSEKTVLYLRHDTDVDLNEYVGAFISDRTVTAGNPFRKVGELNLGQNYLSVRVSRAINLSEVKRFQQLFALILDIYDKKYDSIGKIYSRLIPEFKDHLKPAKSKVSGSERLIALQNQEPDLFIQNYATACERKFQPVVIDKDQVEQAEENGHQVLNYPAESENYFICPDENYPFPGLKQNKMSNNYLYDWLPCCYKTDQTVGKKGLAQYLRGAKGKTRGTGSSYIVSKKVIAPGQAGYLPRNIYKVLQHGKNEKYYRLGVPVSPNSFISAVLLALDDDYDESEEYVADVRNNLAQEDIASVSQQMYDYSEEQIINIIEDPEAVFDSKLFIGLLENHFNCQIIVFVRNEENPNGTFEIPRYTQGYLYHKIDPEKPTVIIYKQSGSRGDYMEYPHYELIISRQGKSETRYFDQEDKTLLRRLNSYFLKCYKAYIVGLGRYQPPPSLTYEGIQGQFIDRYGKARGYLYQDNVHLFVSPSPPIENVAHIDFPEKKPDYTMVAKFIKKTGLKILSQDISNGQAIGVVLDVPATPYVYAPFQARAQINGLPVGENLNFSVPNDQDILGQTVDNRKIADYLMQMIVYDFSVKYNEYLKKNKYQNKLKNFKSLANKILFENTAAMKLVDEYLQENVIIKPGHKYKIKKIPRRITLNNNLFANEQLVADSQETFDKLSFYLRFMVKKNRRIVKEYYRRAYLENYYTFATDFKPNNDQLIFIGTMGIDNWLDAKSHNIENMVETKWNIDRKEPYFMVHWAVNKGKPFIVQNVKNGGLNRALAVGTIFADQGYNPGYDVDPADPTGSTDSTGPTSPVDYSILRLINGVMYQEGLAKLTVVEYVKNFYAAVLFV